MSFVPVFGWIISSVVVLLVLGAMAWHTVVFLRTRANSDMTVWMLSRRWALAVLLCIILLGPSTLARSTTRAVNATDVFVAVDVTGSMAVEDANYGSSDTVTRIKAARDAVYDITEKYPDAQFSAISFGATAAVTLPLTPDAHAMESWADGLTTEPTNVSSGSSLDTPLNTLTTALKAAQDAHPNDTIVLYVITDGEQTSGEAAKSFSVLRPYISDAVVIGVGSEEGGKIPYTSTGVSASSTAETSDAQSWVQDPDTQTDGISQMNESNLKKIADQLSGQYVHVDATKTVANAVTVDASKDYRMTTTWRTISRDVSLIWPFSILFALLAVWEISAWILQSRKLYTL
ncbi:vWA domain-containing protein [Alloscardovia criceti]|uniref:vWA domain-containing protein n=1 Tax=Alloscardovia criceti TaxID=356828 RepID=UPI0003603B2E|nr:VWA domain-containing protein [Alloscardovia criceti]